ncbi:MAG: hypothetical protein ACXVEB_16065, partial [Bacteroidia bacterium]
MTKAIKNISFFLALIALASCGGSGKTPAEGTTDSTVVVRSNADTVKLVKNVILYNIPSPLETFTILKMSGSTFDKALLNPSAKSAGYTSSY